MGFRGPFLFEVFCMAPWDVVWHNGLSVATFCEVLRGCLFHEKPHRDCFHTRIAFPAQRPCIS